MKDSASEKLKKDIREVKDIRRRKWPIIGGLLGAAFGAQARTVPVIAGGAAVGSGIGALAKMLAKRHEANAEEFSLTSSDVKRLVGRGYDFGIEKNAGLGQMLMAMIGKKPEMAKKMVANPNIMKGMKRGMSPIVSPRVSFMKVHPNMMPDRLVRG